MNNKEFLYEYLNNSAPTGFESSGQKIWLNYLNPYIQEHFIDTYGTCVGILRGSNSEYKVVIEAHADEISWFVNYISDDGYIYVVKNGGSDVQIAPAKRVNIYTENGKILKGVFGWPAIHVRNEETNPELKNIFIDVGASSKDEVLKMGIHIGAVITFEDSLFELNNNEFPDRWLVGRALDNRIGGYMIAEVVRKLHEQQITLPFDLYIVNSVQEEIGLRGAQMISRRINPNIAIITDVTHDTQSPMYEKKEEGDIKCGSGPVVSYGPSVQNNLLKLIIEAANKNNLNIQRMAASGSTYTDTDAFAYSNIGVASALISLPLKYMHTTVETVHWDDIKNVINLMYYTLLEIKPEMDFKYF